MSNNLTELKQIITNCNSEFDNENNIIDQY